MVCIERAIERIAIIRGEDMMTTTYVRLIVCGFLVLALFVFFGRPLHAGNLTVDDLVVGHGAKIYGPLTVTNPSATTNGIRVEYTFPSDGTNYVYDSSPYAHTGTVCGAAVWTSAGVVGGGYQFTGNASDYIRIPAASTMNLTSAMTLAFWQKFDSTGTDYMMPVTKNNVGDAANDYWVVQQDASSATNRRIAWIVQLGTCATGTVSGDVWCHVAITHTGTTARMYINGTLVSTGSGVSLPGTQRDILVGRRSDGYGFKGKIDDVRMYDTILTDGQVLDLYLAGYTNHSEAGTIVADRIIQTGNGGTNVFTGNVGIGTNAPNRTMEVRSPSDDAYVRVTGGDAKSAILEMYSDRGDDSGDKWDITAAASDNTLRFRNNTSEKLTITSDGKVGIGTTTPDASLNVVGNVHIADGSQLYWYNNSSYQSLIFNSHSSPYEDLCLWGAGLKDGWAGRIKFYTANSAAVGAPRMIINEDGKVGIGTTTPQYSLEVNGSVLLTYNATPKKMLFERSDGAETGYLYMDGSSAKSDIHLGNSSGTGTISLENDGISRLFIDSSGNVGIGTNVPNGSAGLTISKSNGGLYIKRTETWLDYNAEGANYFGGRSHFRELVTGNTDARIGGSAADSTYFAALGANVGIGTTTPNKRLTVSRASASASEQIELRNEGGISDGQYDGIVFTQGASGSTTLGNIRLNYLSSGQTQMSFATRQSGGALTEVMRLDNAGNVGIGTNSPSEKLHVSGKGRFDQGISYIAPLGDISMGIYTNSP